MLSAPRWVAIEKETRMRFQTKNSAMRLLLGGPLALGLILAGCGGGGGSNGASTGPRQTAQVGPVAVTFAGHPQATISGSSGLGHVGGAKLARPTRRCQSTQYPQLELNCHRICAVLWDRRSGRFLRLTLSGRSNPIPPFLLHSPNQNSYPSVFVKAAFIAFQSSQSRRPTLSTPSCSTSSQAQTVVSKWLSSR